MSDQTTNTVCAVVVTYNPDPAGLVRLLDAVLPQVNAVVVVDNGSTIDVAARLVDQPVSVLPLGRNLGVAVGFNRGIAWAAEKLDSDQVLLLDQDSLPAADMVEQLQAALARLASRGELVAAVGPAAVDATSDHSMGFARMGRLRFSYVHGGEGGEVVADFLISSGSLIPMATLRAVGTMKEGLFIDLVDTEWFLRAGSAGWQAYGVPAAILYHHVGEGNALIQVAGREVGSIHQHEPLRHYYIFRNSIVVSRCSHVPWRWVLNNGMQLLGMFFYFSLVKPPRIRHLCMMLKGLWHGTLGKQGALA
jgi:rhamnosyltransferase